MIAVTPARLRMRATLPAVLLSIVAAAGCGGDDPEPVDPAKEAAAIGTYTLSLYNGSALPFKYAQSDTSRFDVVSGTIVLEADHDMSDEMTTTETRLSDGAPIGVEAIQRYRGTWAVRGDSIRLTYPGLGVQMAGLAGATLTMAVGQVSLTYNK